VSTEGRKVSTTPIVGGLVIVCLIWGSTWLAIKEGLASIPPFLAAGVRFIIASILLRLVMAQQGERIPTDRRYWMLILETGLLTYSIPFAFMYWGQRLIPSGLSSVLFATYPFFVAMAARFRVPGERLPLMRVVGILLGFVGVVAIFSGELNVEHGFSAIGMACIVIGAALQAWALVSVRLKGQEIHPGTLTFGGMIIGATVLSTSSLLLEDYSTLLIDQRAIVSTLYLAAFGSVITFITYFWLVKHVNPVLLSLTAFVTPFIAVSLGAVVLDEQLGTRVLLGGLLVLAGVLFANVPGLRSMMRRPESEAST
jgi:drug/metabolite transporter (DMT)-like permease